MQVDWNGVMHEKINTYECRVNFNRYEISGQGWTLVKCRLEIKNERERMSVLPVSFFVAGAALLIFGFKKNNRMLLTVAAFLWLSSGAWDEFMHGFKAGVSNNAPVVSPAPGH